MNNEILARLRAQFPVGARVELVRMNDDYAPPVGTRGLVRGVDDIGSIMVAWDNGSGLNVVCGEDECVLVRQCPKCHKEYTAPPAISRQDNETEICSRCGTLEALEQAHLPPDEVERIMRMLANEK